MPFYQFWVVFFGVVKAALTLFSARVQRQIFSKSVHRFFFFWVRYFIRYLIFFVLNLIETGREPFKSNHSLFITSSYPFNPERKYDQKWCFGAHFQFSVHTGSRFPVSKMSNHHYDQTWAYAVWISKIRLLVLRIWAKSLFPSKPEVDF